jgi:hypothetical protein
VLPTLTPATNPVLLTVPTAADDELQLTELVRFCVVPSEKIPVAVSCRLVPLAIDGFTGVMVSDVKVTTTLSVVAPVTGPSTAWKVAVIRELPWL